MKEYGENFVDVFNDCDASIGIALDFRTNDSSKSKGMTAKVYCATWGLTKEITEDNILYL